MTRYALLNQRLQSITQNNSQPLLKGALTGIEKESLRVSSDGLIAQTKHPKVLGSALTHPYITTDYSEAQLEFITPPLADAKDALAFLQDIHSFVYQSLDKELLWANSMPCIISGEASIRIAEFGSSNQGRMKHVYRQGLSHRYGKMMQVISGIHFNHSIAEAFWPAFQDLEEDKRPLQAFINDGYMALVRNLLRYGWIVPYLFGASPAICRTFLGGIPKPENMLSLPSNTFYEPFGTSLRMGDIGYTNNKERESGIKAGYNSLAEYTSGLRQAINTPFAAYENIGVKVDGVYKQLNANLLQIENEYYSTVRPKQILQGLEKPVDALDQRGIRYIELRSLDLNPMQAAGLGDAEVRFLESFILFCLLQDSPLIDKEEQQMIQRNQSRVAHQGRKPDLVLERRRHGDASLKAWLNELLSEIQPVAALLDDVHGHNEYTDCLANKFELAAHPDATPSARVVDELQTNKESFFEFSKRKSLEHREFFLQRALSAEHAQRFTQARDESLQAQQVLEANSTESFDDFLKAYFKQ